MSKWEAVASPSKLQSWEDSARAGQIILKGGVVGEDLQSKGVDNGFVIGKWVGGHKGGQRQEKESEIENRRATTTRWMCVGRKLSSSWEGN